jgi:hypothetical protein
MGIRLNPLSRLLVVIAGAAKTISIALTGGASEHDFMRALDDSPQVTLPAPGRCAALQQ